VALKRTVGVAHPGPCRGETSEGDAPPLSGRQPSQGRRLLLCCAEFFPLDLPVKTPWVPPSNCLGIWKLAGQPGKQTDDSINLELADLLTVLASGDLQQTWQQWNRDLISATTVMLNGNTSTSSTSVLDCQRKEA
jgi:hypothetical protein